MAKRSFFAKYKFHTLTFLVLIGLGAWAGIVRFAQPAEINEVTYAKVQKIDPQMHCLDGACKPAPTGCYYQQVQCIQAPCNPVLVCASPTPKGSCTPRPACLDSNPACMIALAPEQEFCPVSSTKPSPIAPPTCRAQVSSLKLSTRCGATGFMTYDYSCDGGKTSSIKAETCLEASEIYSLAQQACRTSCGGRVTQ
jgi:hypothetical protein